MKQHYKTLEVEESATQGEIKKSWKRLSGIYHPDKQGGSTEKQSEINAAYSVLGDPISRADYDQIGDAKQIGCNIDEMAIEVICSVFTMIIKGDFRKDTLFRDVHDSVSNVLENLKVEKSALKGQAYKLETKIAFLKRTLKEKSQEGMTILEKAFNNTIEELDQDINSLDLNSANLGIAIHEKALKILEDNYPSEPEQEFDFDELLGGQRRTGGLGFYLGNQP